MKLVTNTVAATLTTVQLELIRAFSLPPSHTEYAAVYIIYTAKMRYYLDILFSINIKYAAEERRQHSLLHLSELLGRKLNSRFCPMA